MTHNEDRSHWLKEGLIGLSTGILYGTTSIIVGHPFDTVKTKMQAQKGFVEKGSSGMFGAFLKTIRTQGFFGLYKGWWPPLWGSGIYRSTQFAVFEALYTKWDTELGRKEIPYTLGLQYRVLWAGFSASFCRAVLECPIEFAKVARQTQQNWKFKDLYKGFGLQLSRTTGVMVTYFVLIDSFRRNYKEIFSTKTGQFIASAGSATIGFWLVWPFEVLKNQVQAGTEIEGKKGNISIIERMKYLKQSHGISGLYRGLLPGTLRSVFSNGCSMIVMIYAQRKVSEWGLRD